MGGLIAALVAMFALVVDYSTTAIGAGDLMGIWGVVVSLVVQAVQLGTLIYLRSEAAENAPPFHRGVAAALATVTTLINAFYNLAALYGATSWDDLTARALHGHGWPVRLVAMATLSLAITTEFESYLSYAVKHRALVGLSTVGLPLMIGTPLYIIAFVAGLFQPLLDLVGIRPWRGEARTDIPLISIAMLAIASVALRAFDILSTYATLFANDLQAWLAIYVSLLCSAVQIRALLLFSSGRRPDPLETARLVAVSVVNIYGSAAFLARLAGDFEGLGLAAMGLLILTGAMFSISSELLEMLAVRSTLAVAVRGGSLQRMSEEEIMRAVASAVPMVVGAAFGAGAALAAPIATMLRGIGMAVSGMMEAIGESMRMEEIAGEAGDNERGFSRPAARGQQRGDEGGRLSGGIADLFRR